MKVQILRDDVWGLHRLHTPVYTPLSISPAFLKLTPSKSSSPLKHFIASFFQCLWSASCWSVMDFLSLSFRISMCLIALPSFRLELLVKRRRLHRSGSAHQSCLSERLGHRDLVNFVVTSSFTHLKEIPFHDTLKSATTSHLTALNISLHKPLMEFKLYGGRCCCRAL